MKLCLIVLSLLLFTGCNSKQMSLQPSAFPRETQAMLDLVDDIYFYDVNNGVGAKRQKISLYECNAGEWHQSSYVYLNKPLSERIGFQIKDYSIDIYDHTNSNITVASFEYNNQFHNQLYKDYGILDNLEPIAYNEEHILYLKIASSSAIKGPIDMYNLDDIYCELGLAITFAAEQ